MEELGTTFFLISVINQKNIMYIGLCYHLIDIVVNHKFINKSLKYLLHRLKLNINS